MAKKKKPLSGGGTATAIYARYSSHNQNDASIEQQIAECELYASQNGLNIVATFEDRAISGKRDNRPGFQRMLRAAERHEFQVLLAYKSNRIARNMINALKTEERLEQAGVRVVYCKEEFGNNVTGRFMLRTMMNMNQFYSENMAEDIARGMHDSANKGKVVASMPLGYKKGEDGKYVIDEETAPVVREIFDRVANGEAFMDIARDLNERHILTKRKKPWGKNSFRWLLQNERYTGVYIYDDVRIEGGMPQIIERSVFEVVQKRLESLSDIRAKHKSKENYLLTGKLFCAKCLSPMIGKSANGNGGKYLYYSCQGHIKKNCEKKSVQKEWIEEEVTKAFTKYMMEEGVIDWLVDSFMMIAQRHNEESELGRHQEELAEVNRQIQNILRAVEMGFISDTFKERIAELEDEKKKLTGLIAIEQATRIKVDKKEVRSYFERIQQGNYKDRDFQYDILKNYIRAAYLDEKYVKISFNFTGEVRMFKFMFTEPPDGGGGGEDDADLVRLKHEEGHHFYLKRTTDDGNFIEVTESGFVLVWYFKNEGNR